MGYEEVETVLPADFVPRADPVPEQAKEDKAAAAAATAEAEESLLPVLVEASEPESEAEDAACGGLRKKMKKKRRKSKGPSGRSGGRSSEKKSVLARWRSHRSKSRGRKKKSEGGGADGGADGSSSSSTKKKGEEKKRSKLSFRTIRKVDSNATEVRDNTSKAKEVAKEDREETKDENEGELAAKDEEVAAINEASLPTVREGSPANTTVTSLTNEEDAALTYEEIVADKAGQADKMGITSPSPAPSTMSAGALSIEVGNETEEVDTIAIESPFAIVPFAAFSENNEEEAKEAAATDDQGFPTTLALAPSKDASVRSNKSNRSTKSNASVKSLRSIRSKKSGESIKASKSIESIKASKSIESIKAAKSYESIKGVKSGESTKSIKSSKSGEKFPPVTAAMSGEASVRSTRSAKSTSSNKSSSSKRSLRSLKSKSKSVEEDNEAAPLVDDEKEDEEEAAEGATGEIDVADGSPQQEKWVKKVSVSIGGYKTSFQFSDPMANIAQAVNDALDVAGMDDAKLIQQARDIETNATEDEEIVEEERDYDENPTRLFMYLQQRAWGLALTQLHKHPEEARVWVYRKAKPEKAPDVHDADDNSKALVVQHTALVVHDGREMPKFRWKLLPLHAAIVLGAPTEIIQEVIRAYPTAARKTDERGSYPVHLAASRLDVDPEGEKVVLQLFGAFPDSIELKDRKGRTPPELAKLARARKDIEEQRKIQAITSQPSQVGQECTASQYVREEDDQEAEDDGEAKEEGGSGDDDDDDRSVKSSFSGRFSQMLRKSKSTDTVDRRKRKIKKKDKKKARQDVGLSAAASVDAGEDTSVDDATIFESLGPGFAFLTTSKNQEVRESQEASSRMGSEEEEEEDEVTEEEVIVAAKKAMVSQQYQVPDAAPGDFDYAVGIPLPQSFSMGDDSSVRSSRSTRSTRSARSARSPKSTPKSTPVSSPASSPTNEDAAIDAATASAKSVSISSDEPEVQEIDPETPGADSNASSGVDSVATVNQGLRVLLEKAVENAGRGGMDVTAFVKNLEDEWVTDVEALRRLDGETLDELLPIMLSRELQRLINHADSIDSEFLKGEKQGITRGRSPKKSSKKKKKKRSHRKAKKRSHHRPITPPNGILSPITEEKSPGSVNSDDMVSVVTEARTVYSAQSAPPNLLVPIEDDEEDDEEDDDEEEYDDDLPQSASIEDLEIRKLHANLIADARKKFPTREALEDSIRERQGEVEMAVNSGFDVDKQTLARAALADDEVRKLLPLRLILPTVADLNEMISVLQLHKEDAIRSLDMEASCSIATEIEELRNQIHEENRYLMMKRMGETKCSSCLEMFPTEKRQTGILKTTHKKCAKCRGGGTDSSSVRQDIETVDSRDDENN